MKLESTSDTIVGTWLSHKTTPYVLQLRRAAYLKRMFDYLRMLFFDLLSFVRQQQKLCDETTPIILIGDFNARTGNIPENLDIDQNFDYSGLEQTESP